MIKLGGRCPLNFVSQKELEEFMKIKLEKFYERSINLTVENMKKEFCKNICKNILC